MNKKAPHVGGAPAAPTIRHSRRKWLWRLCEKLAPWPNYANSSNCTRPRSVNGRSSCMNVPQKYLIAAPRPSR
jgi:hypothetical protein